MWHIAHNGSQISTSRHAMAERSHHREMAEKPHFRENFFSVKNVAPPRPDSVLTEFMETDWEEDDILSELDEAETPPRLSLDSVSGLMHPNTASSSSFLLCVHPLLMRYLWPRMEVDQV